MQIFNISLLVCNTQFNYSWKEEEKKHSTDIIQKWQNYIQDIASVK